MGFKTVKSYNEEKFGGLFRLINDGDYADVIFMYRNEDDVLIADATHYIKSAQYSGYVHCCGRGCPACAKGIRVQTKLFIPLYNIQTGEIEFFDRTMRFEPQLHQDVFSKYPNPSEFVFRITRKGAAGDVNTAYTIMAVGKNTFKSYGQILAEKNASFPEYYNNICKEVTSDDLHSMVNSSADTNAPGGAMPSYQVTPRAYGNTASTNPAVATPNTAIPEFNVPSNVGYVDEVSEAEDVGIDTSYDADDVDDVDF